MPVKSTTPAADRFRLLYSVSESGCWVWQGSTLRNGGHGLFNAGNRKTVQAHRFAWENTHGPIPAGACVCHSCDNPRCVNPDHLFLGTHDDNMKDAVKKGRFPRGEATRLSKLDAEKVREIRRRYDEGGGSIAALAREHGVSGVVIWRVVTRKGWKHVA